jgi:hypothetical protein
MHFRGQEKQSEKIKCRTDSQAGNGNVDRGAAAAYRLGDSVDRFPLSHILAIWTRALWDRSDEGLKTNKSDSGSWVRRTKREDVGHLVDDNALHRFSYFLYLALISMGSRTKNI